MLNFKHSTKNLFQALVLSLFFLLLASTSYADKIDLSGRIGVQMERDLTSKPEQVIAFAKVKKDDKVLDFLAGAGYYSEILSRVVGDSGKVYMQNNKAYVQYVSKFLEQHEPNGYLSKVVKIVSEAGQLNLGEEKYDKIFFILGYHDLFYKEQGWDFPADLVMPQLHRALKPDGTLLIIDHAAAKGRGFQDVPNLHRIEESSLQSDIAKRGFKLIDKLDILRNKDDDYAVPVTDPKVRRKTDRFILLYKKI